MRTAIIGLACLFPGAPDLAGFWRNIVDGVDAIGDVPPGRWDPVFHDPASSAVDRFYCKRGGFVDAWALFDPLPFGVVPNEVAAAEPDQLLTLKVGHEALRDAGYDKRPFARERTGVIVGRGNYVSAGVLRLEQHVRLLPQLLQTLADLFPDLPPNALAAAQAKLREACGHYGPDVAAGLIPNLIASRLANRLDLQGPAYTVDAACASALIAVEQAIAALHGGQADLMLVGAAHLTHDLTFWATFCQLGAMSRSGVIRPLAADADGLLASEGVGMAVLKRLDDALADGDRVYAVIEGTGSASDGRAGSLVAPSAAGQRMALQRAWQGLPFAPDAIGLLEAHGTGTPAGDAAELETVAAFFGNAQRGLRPVIGSVKSNIGHAMPASGMASLIKTALSIHHGLLPPTLHCERPHPRLAETRFRTIGRSEPWTVAAEDRIGAVNAFGFGGINAHLVLRGLPAAHGHPASPRLPALPPLLLLSADTPPALLQRLDAGEWDCAPGSGVCRLVVTEPDAARLDIARKAIAAGRPWHGRNGVWYSAQGLLGTGRGKLAFLFPGVDGASEIGPSLTHAVVALLAANRQCFDALAELRVRADAFAGHSVGEWSAMLCSGMMDQGLSDRINAGLERDAPTFPDLPYLAAQCGAETLSAAMAGIDGLSVSHDNCPHQSVACGTPDAIDRLAVELRSRGVVAHRLPFVSGFHSPRFADHMAWYRDFFGAALLAEPATPVWSATSAQPFPVAEADKRRLALAHLLQPVRFGALIDAMYDQGFRVFVQVGAGALTAFVGNALAGRPHLAVAARHERRDLRAQLQQVCAALWIEAAEFDTALLAGTPGSARRLSLGVPLLRVPPLEAALRLPLPAIAGDDPVAQAVRDTLADIDGAAREVLALWDRHRGGAVRLRPWRVQRRLDLASTIPAVLDHGLYPQDEGWPIVADRHPVVPMTMAVTMLRETVQAALPPGRTVVEMRGVQALHWLAVAEPLTVEIALQPVTDELIEAEIVGYFKATVVVAGGYPPPDDGPLPALLRSRPAAIGAEALYRDRWMFHGPAYQGVLSLGPVGDNGIDGRLRVPAGPGGLLDNMGQLAGYWVMEQADNCLAMPIGIDRIRFFGDDPQAGEALSCAVRIDRLDALSCHSSHRLHDARGRLRIAIDGWQTRRYEMDRAFWLRTQDLAHHELSRPLAIGVALFEDAHDSANVRDYLVRRYLTESERSTYDALAPRRRRQWLNGRIAAKDAVRAWLRRTRGVDGLYPQQICIDNETSGAPRIRAQFTAAVPATLQLSLTHKDRMAAAIVGERPVGIDIERVEARAPGFAATVFDAAELACLGGEDPRLGWARGWVAKEVAAKAAGTGLAGHLRRLTVEARDGDRLRVAGHRVVTRVLGDYVIGWSEDEPTERGTHD